MSHTLSRWAFPVFSAAALSIFTAGCLPYLIGASASSKSSVDPEFSKTHDLNFKQPSTKMKAALLFETKGSFVGFPKGPCGNAFLEAMKNSGAFSQVAEVSNESNLQKYPGWDVIRIQLSSLGLGDMGGRSYREKYQVKVRFEFKTAGDTAEYIYFSSLWHAEYGAKPPTDEAHPLTGQVDQTIKLFAQEIVVAALSEAQRSGRYFQ